MAFTFKGTYTKNRGDAVATGTVGIFTKRGVEIDTATLDENGSYELELDAQEGEVTVVETLDGVPVNRFPAGVSRGSTTDTSRDIGYVGPAQSGATVDLSAYDEGTPVSITGTNDDGAGIYLHASDGGVTLIADSAGALIDLAADTGVNIGAVGSGGTVIVTADTAVLIGGAGAADVNIGSATGNVTIATGTGEVQIQGPELGFYGQTPVAQQTGVAVTAGAIHAALVALGLITA